MDDTSVLRRARLALRIAPWLLVLIVWWRWLPEAPVPQQWNDSTLYLNAHIRPWVATTFWRTLGPSPWAVYALATLSLTTWGRLGWVTFGWPGVALAFTVAGCDLVRSWNWTVLSEPLALSGLAWFAAETITVRRDPSWRSWLLWLGAVCLVSSRIATALVVLPAALAIGRRNWKLVPIGLALVAIPFWQQHGNNETERWQAANVAIMRVPNDPRMLYWMQRHGFPWPIDEGWRVNFVNLEELRKHFPEFVEYVDGPFRWRYYQYLLQFPEHTLRSALAAYPHMPAGALYPKHGIAFCDEWWNTVENHVGFLALTVVALMLAPWAGIAGLVLLVATYHGVTIETPRYMCAIWAWDKVLWFVAGAAGVKTIQSGLVGLCRRIARRRPPLFLGRDHALFDPGSVRERDLALVAAVSSDDS